MLESLTYASLRPQDSWVEIRDAAGRNLVTAIEILSPWNKRGRGRAEYCDRLYNTLKRLNPQRCPLLGFSADGHATGICWRAVA